MARRGQGVSSWWGAGAAVLLIATVVSGGCAGSVGDLSTPEPPPPTQPPPPPVEPPAPGADSAAVGASDASAPQQVPAPQPAATPAPPLKVEEARALGRLQAAARSPRVPAPGMASFANRDAPIQHRRAEFHTEAYDRIDENAFRRVIDEPLSTFSVDVDTAAYANVRRFLGGGTLPPADAVRVEEMINYFRFDYPEPRGDVPFSVTTAVAACPWAPQHRLVSIGLQGRRLPREELPPLNLVFLLDVSGSMGSPDKLPLLKGAMKLLVDQLSERDRVAIVVYAGSSGLVLPPTPGSHRGTIRDALERLQAGGSTAGGAGIQLAYRVAAESYVGDGVNRVILATDGDFNVGITSQGELLRLIEEKREQGVSLSVLGFGTGNLKDSTMEKLADRGNGNYSYIDSLHEARKVLVAEAGGTLVTIAKDVKLQLEFNPGAVSAYRLIGYENRVLAAQDFNDDRKDAGEIGAGHSVTALYEVVPAGVPLETPGVDPLRYQTTRRPVGDAPADELLTVKLRYKAPEGDRSRLLEQPVLDGGAAAPEGELRFAAAVAAFGMVLRGSEHRGEASFDMVLDLARGSRGDDPEGHRAEFLKLVRLAESLAAPAAQLSRR